MVPPRFRVLSLTSAAALGVLVGGVAAASRSVSVTVAASSRATRGLAREARPIIAHQRAVDEAGGIVSPKGPVHAPAWLVLLEVAVFVAAAVLLAALVVPALRRWREDVRTRAAAPAAPGSDESQPEVAERSRLAGEVAGALEALDEQRDARAAVIVCWSRLEAAVAGSGAPRGVSETSGELTARVLGDFAVDPDDLRALHGAYRLARFSSAPLDHAERDAARRALVRLSGALGDPR